MPAWADMFWPLRGGKAITSQVLEYPGISGAVQLGASLEPFEPCPDDQSLTLVLPNPYNLTLNLLPGGNWVVVEQMILLSGGCSPLLILPYRLQHKHLAPDRAMVDAPFVSTIYVVT